MNYRKVWSDTFGPIIKGFHVHHIIPRCEFDKFVVDNPNSKLARYGVDWIGNLIALHVDDHLLIHKMRGDTVSEKFIGKANNWLGKKRSAEDTRKMVLRHKGQKRSDESKEKMSKAWNREVRECPHCGRCIGNNYTKYHGNNCKTLKEI